MSGFAKGIKYGVSVRQGQTIGYVGSTGLATGPHVCYRFWVNGRQVDAQKQKLPPSDPIPEYLKKEFFIIRDSLKEKLDSIGIFQYDLATRESIPEFN
jgi:murein DD-endopeptidase MepM/ murein hydrolase activator NlpD